MAKKEKAAPALVVDYDLDTDVLFISSGAAGPSEGSRGRNGLIVRYPLNDPLVACGVVVVQFRSSGWASNVAKLAVVVANILSVEPEQMFGALRRYHAPSVASTSHAA
jgi:hypothetical protein